MQAYHRKRHRIVWLLLPPLAIAIVVIAVSKRPVWPVQEALPTEPAAATGNPQAE